jgi:hypothetical protein
MAFDLARLKKQATIAATVAGLILFAIGILAFALALRPCRYAFQPGEVVAYKLTTTTTELRPDGKPAGSSVELRELQLVCTGPDNEIALICPAADGSARRDQVTLLDVAPDGTAARLDAAARPSDQGVAIGFFDFNLMPLPEGSEQPRDVTISYAVLPSARNPVQGKVRRTKAGAKPTFQLKLQSSVEWLGSDNRYHQVRDLVSTYRFNTAKGMVEEATVKLLAGVERDDGAHRFQVEIKLALDGPPSRTDEDPHRLRDAVLASAEAQELLRENDRERSTAAAERLRTAEIAMPQLRALADRLCDAILHPQAEAPHTYLVRIARGPARERAQAETLVHRLIAAGFPAGLRPVGDEVEVLAGPYQNPDPMVLGSIAKGFPQFSPTWIDE